MPNLGIFFFKICFIVGIANFPVALGSPGPLLKKIPFGFNLKISLALVVAGTTVTLQPSDAKFLNILSFAP